MLVIGAGLSGIGMAHRLGESCPDLSYAVLEARAVSGGTWDLFRYPGVRSDSDMFTLSFPFRPWTGRDSIAQGGDILDYLRGTSRELGIEERIHYGSKVTGAAWSTREQRWTVEVVSGVDRPGAGQADGGLARRQVRAAYLHFASGYYSYAEGYTPQLPGRGDFTGPVVHPQFWPEDLDHTGKRVVVIGSGATAVTLVPAMVAEAGHVVMLQRTPSYLFSVPGSDPIANRLRKALPAQLAHKVIRGKNIRMQSFIYRLSRRRPAWAKRLIMSDVRRRLPEDVVSEHFEPPYGVWDQRLCAVPDGDFFDAVSTGTASVVTGHIDRFVPEGIRLTDGRLVEADIIVTATGLRLEALGGTELSVDGEPVRLGERYAYRGVMLSGVPNLSMTVGYVNASWTLRADLIARYVVRLLRHLRDYRLGVAVPVAPEGMRAAPLLDLTAGYVQRAINAFPKVGDRDPWTMPQDYLRDRSTFVTADVRDDMVFLPVGAPADCVPSGAPAPASLDRPGLALSDPA